MTEEARPHRRWILATGAVLALLIGVVVSWSALAAADARHDVDAIPRSFTCDGLEIPYSILNSNGESEGDSPQPAFVVPLATVAKPGAMCQLELTIVNQGPRTVKVESVAFPRLGVTDNGGFPLELGATGANFPASSPDDKGSAVVDVRKLLRPGGTIDLRFDIRVREPQVLLAADHTMSSGMLPDIKISYRGFTGMSKGSVAIAVKG